MEQKINIEIWSDVICPFCYIGKRRLEKALEGFTHKDQVSITWKSYQLMPGMVTEPGKSIHQLLAERYNMSTEEAKAANQRVTDMAAGAGLSYDLDKAIPANSLKAHQLIHFAATQGLQDAAEERLFRAYFTEGKNIDDNTTLLQLGTEIGLEEKQLEQVLNTQPYTADINQDIQEAQQIGVRGVPFFVFNRKYGVSGAQEVPVFLETLQKALEG